MKQWIMLAGGFILAVGLMFTLYSLRLEEGCDEMCEANDGVMLRRPSKCVCNDGEVYRLDNIFLPSPEHAHPDDWGDEDD